MAYASSYTSCNRPCRRCCCRPSFRLYALRHDGAREGYVAVVRETMAGVYEIIESLCASVNSRIRTGPQITMEILLGFFDQGSAMSYLDLGRIDADAQVERLTQLMDVIIETDGTC